MQRPDVVGAHRGGTPSARRQPPTAAAPRALRPQTRSPATAPPCRPRLPLDCPNVLGQYDRHGRRASGNTGSDGRDDEHLIALLAPPPRPRRQVVFAVAATAALVAAIVAVSAAGAWYPDWTCGSTTGPGAGDSLTVAFDPQSGLRRREDSFARRAITRSRRDARGDAECSNLHAHHEREVSVHFDRFDCATVIGSRVLTTFGFGSRTVWASPSPTRIP